MLATNLILIRHGETAWNAERRLQGHIDIPLNGEGMLQARALGKILATEKLDAIISSDLQRAHQTACFVQQEQAAQGRVLSIQTDSALRERCFGGFEGLTYTELATRYPQEFAAYKARDPNGQLPPGEREGESFTAFFERVMRAVHAWAAQFGGQTVALVAHGGVLECAYRAALNLPLSTPRDFDIYNASINRFTWQDGRLQLQQWGEISHLDEDVLDELNADVVKA